MKHKKRIKLGHLLRPHRGMLALAFIAVLGEAATDLLEPWPLKIVFDYVFATKRMPAWMLGLLSATFGLTKVAILHFAIVAVIIIALAGALSAYAEKYLTTSVGQWVMHDLRRVLYHHIQRLSLAYHDHKPAGDLISTVTADIDSIQDFISQALLGILVNVLTLAGMLAVMFYLNWRFTLIALSVTSFLFAVVYTYRPPPRNHPARRRYLRDRSRHDRRAWHPRGVAQRRRTLFTPLRDPISTSIGTTHYTDLKRECGWSHLGARFPGPPTLKTQRLSPHSLKNPCVY